MLTYQEKRKRKQFPFFFLLKATVNRIMLSDMSDETSTKAWQCYIITHLIFTKYLIYYQFYSRRFKK